MYETGGDLCPVKSYQLYLMKLHPLQPRLFQQPRRKATPDSPMWYGKAPIGEKALQQMMANISGFYPLTKLTKHIIPYDIVGNSSSNSRDVVFRLDRKPGDQCSHFSLLFSLFRKNRKRFCAPGGGVRVFGKK